MEGRLHLDAAHGDAGLGSIKCVVRITADTTAHTAAVGQPVSYNFGHDSFSSALGDVTHAASQGGGALLVSLPPGLQMGYGVFTSTYVDRVIARIGGAPDKYLHARSHLALYQAGDVDAQRRALEAETVAQAGFSLPHSELSPASILGRLQPGPDAAVAQDDIRAAAEGFSSLPIDALAGYWAGLVQEPSVQMGELITLMRGLVVASVEAEVMNLMRRWRFEALAGAGYQFYLGQARWNEVEPVSPTQQRERLDELQRHLASGRLLEGDLAWLKAYVGQAIQIMQMELETPRLGA